MVLEKLKKQSNAYKMHLTRSLNSLSEEISKGSRDRNVDLIKQYLQQVESKYDRWESAIMQLQDKDPDMDIDKSMSDIDITLDSVISAKVKANDIIDKGKDIITVRDDVFDPGAPRPHIAKDRMKLPRVEMKKFNGTNIEYYQEWYQMFMATIDKSSLSTVEKL